MADNFIQYFKKNCSFSIFYGILSSSIVCAERFNVKVIKDALLQIKERYVYKYLKKELLNYEIEYKLIGLDKRTNTVSLPIFCCWLQGLDKMPEIVKTCFSSIKENANGHSVIFICEKNVGEYITIPEIILKKYHESMIGPAHFLDYIRAALLSKYGGVWLDATVFVTQKIPEWYFQIPFFSIKYPKTESKQISGCEWTGFALGEAVRKLDQSGNY